MNTYSHTTSCIVGWENDQPPEVRAAVGSVLFRQWAGERAMRACARRRASLGRAWLPCVHSTAGRQAASRPHPQSLSHAYLRTVARYSLCRQRASRRSAVAGWGSTTIHFKVNHAVNSSCCAWIAAGCYHVRTQYVPSNFLLERTG